MLDFIARITLRFGETERVLVLKLRETVLKLVCRIMLKDTRRQRLYASHRQFYVQDAGYPGDTGAPSLWSTEAVRDRLAVVPGTIGIGTGSYGFVHVTTEIHGDEPFLDPAPWDHAVEASLEIQSGVLQVIGCLSDAGEDFEVSPGQYRVRCCSANLEDSVELGEGPDWYLVQVWPAPKEARRILKRWTLREGPG